MAVTVRQLLELFFLSPSSFVSLHVMDGSLLFSGHPSDPDLCVYLDMPVWRCYWSHAGVLDVDLLEGGEADV